MWPDKTTALLAYSSTNRRGESLKLVLQLNIDALFHLYVLLIVEITLAEDDNTEIMVIHSLFYQILACSFSFQKTSVMR